MRIRALLIAPFVALIWIAGTFAAEALAPAAGFAADFALAETVLDLGSSLVSREADSAAGFFTLAVKNSAGLPVARVLTVADSPAAGLALLPPSARAALIEAQSSDSAVAVERVESLGTNAFRVTVPAAGTASLALRFNGVAGRPSLLAWTESALLRHDRQLAVLLSATSALLAASFAFALGAAVLTGTLFARRAAGFLAAILLVQFTGSAVFDTAFLTLWGGPHGLLALGIAAALAAAIRLVNHIAPYDAIRPGLARWLDHAALGILALGLLAYLGMPLLGLLIRIFAVMGAVLAAVYLAYCGRAGNIGARRLAPAAAIFALVAAAATFNSLGAFGVNLVASGAIGGFSAAGALLVAIATALPLDPAAQRVAAALGAASAQGAGGNEEAGRREIEAVAASHQGVFEMDLQSGAVSLSAEAARLLGFASSAAEIGFDVWQGRIHPDDRSVFRDALNAYRRDPGIAFRIEFRAQGQGGRMAWFELRATMAGEGEEAERCLGLIANVTARKNLEGEDISPRASDPLTGLGTRAELNSHLDGMRGKLKTAALAVFDLDRFKSVNDSLGRDGGDALLIAFAGRLNEAFGGPAADGTMLFRVGGDMFAAIARNASDAKGFGERLVDLLTPPFTIAGREIYLLSSVGVASGKNAQDAQDLFAQAEMAMIAAKREGGGRAVVHSKALGPARLRDSVALETGLRRALERGEIETHYQPIVRLKDGSVVGFEALLRWRHPERGIVEPDAFVPQAERSGLILPLGKFALQRSVENLAHWQTLFPAQPPLYVSVNVTWRQIRDKSFAKDMAELLRGLGTAKGSLKLEVTEGQLMAASRHADAALKRLKLLGVGLSIDDFGAGHSSLGRLASFPFDTVKIDKSFVTDSATASGAKILKAMIHLARDLDLAVVCEGIETGEEAALLKALGCDFGQGFLFGAPVPASDINAMIAKAQ